jgi:hypothetical protein
MAKTKKTKKRKKSPFATMKNSMSRRFFLNHANSAEPSREQRINEKRQHDIGSLKRGFDF